MAKQRPNVDPKCWDIDMKWELAADFQRTWEQFCDEQKLND